MSAEELTADEVARLAEVDRAFVDRAVAAGALGPAGGRSFTRDDAARLRVLRMWDAAGLPVASIAAAVARGDLSFGFLDNPTMAVGDQLDVAYDVWCSRQGIDLATIQAIHESLGFTPPEGTDPARSDDIPLVGLFRAMTSAGAGDSAVWRLLRVYADGLRRIAEAEREFYEAEVEGPLRREGHSDLDLLDRGAAVGRDLMEAIEATLLSIYRRHRSHVWLDHSVGHVEVILEAEGLYRRSATPPSVCFVDLAGYTRITDELGDSAAADLAGRLAALVSGISQRHEGRPVRWLGDGGMFVFRHPAAAVAAATEIVVASPEEGLPPTHIGIHTGPLVFQDGDIYGGTVNIAARLSARAEAGEILVSAPVAAGVPEVAFEPIGPVSLKGVAHPIDVFRVKGS
ncbi:MAG: adenylate/guanylate cyclase domain-containing protein [Actinobacteria bacterium]|nr:MAG: adenylate/guanylate cyclase domain-containing protein [Actinomycetota bacterium]